VNKSFIFQARSTDSFSQQKKSTLEEQKQGTEKGQNELSVEVDLLGNGDCSTTISPTHHNRSINGTASTTGNFYDTQQSFFDPNGFQITPNGTSQYFYRGSTEKREAIKHMEANPSKKFAAKLIEKKASHEHQMMDRRVTKLKQQQEKANNKMLKTLQILQIAEDVRDRRMTDMKNKHDLIMQRNAELEHLKECNYFRRDLNKKTIAK